MVGFQVSTTHHIYEFWGWSLSLYMCAENLKVKILSLKDLDALPDALTHTFNLSTPEARGRWIFVSQSWSGLHVEFRASQYYSESTSQNKKSQKLDFLLFLGGKIQKT